jgi:hypothetical protein
MAAIEPSENPSRTLTWKLLAFLSPIKCRTNDDRFSASQWESFFFSSLGVPTPSLLGPAQQCASNAFSYDTFGDHLQTCETKSAASQVHDWVVYKLGALLGSVGHRVKIHKITPATGKERGDIEIKDYVVLQKPQSQDNRLPPPRTLIMVNTMTHIRFGRSHLHRMGQLTNTRRSVGAPDPDGSLKEVARIKIRHYWNVYLNRPDPIAFIPLAVDTTGRLYDEFIRLLFLYAHREASALANELPEESDKFRFLRASCFANLKGAVGLILAKASAMRIPIPRVHVMYDSLTHQLGPSNRCTCRVLTEAWVKFIADMLGAPLSAGARLSSCRHASPQHVRNKENTLRI